MGSLSSKKKKSESSDDKFKKNSEFLIKIICRIKGTAFFFF